MIFLSIILISIFILLPVFVWLSKYYNPYKCILFIGLPGSGKTTEMTKQAILHTRGNFIQRLLHVVPRFQTVYANMYLPNSFEFEADDLGMFQVPEDTLMIIDEAGIYFDSRKFKTFSNAARNFLKLHRQHRVKMIFASQSTDVDKKIRDLCDEIWIMRCIAGVLIVKRRVNKIIDLSNNTVNNSGSDTGTINLGGDIVEKYKYFGLPRFTFVPRYVEFFRSYNPPELPQIEHELREYSEVQQQLLSTRHYIGRKAAMIAKKFLTCLKALILLVKSKFDNRLASGSAAGKDV